MKGTRVTTPGNPPGANHLKQPARILIPKEPQRWPWIRRVRWMRRNQFAGRSDGRDRGNGSEGGWNSTWWQLGGCHGKVW